MATRDELIQEAVAVQLGAGYARAAMTGASARTLATKAAEALIDDGYRRVAEDAETLERVANGLTGEGEAAMKGVAMTDEVYLTDSKVTVQLGRSDREVLIKISKPDTTEYSLILSRDEASLLGDWLSWHAEGVE